MYVAASQAPLWTTRMIVNARLEGADTAGVATGVRERIAAIDRGLAAEIAPMTHYLGEMVARDRMVTTLLNGFAAVAVALATRRPKVAAPSDGGPDPLSTTDQSPPHVPQYAVNLLHFRETPSWNGHRLDTSNHIALALSRPPLEQSSCRSAPVAARALG